MPSPFDHVAPHPWAERAARELQASLPADEGKMFGVLVVEDRDGRLGWLRAFSGMLGGRWVVPGFAPPLFDPAAMEAFWPAAEAELETLDARIRALAADGARAELAARVAAQDADAAALRDRHAARRAARRAARAAGADPAPLARESRGDAGERARLEAAHAAARAPLAARIATLDAELGALGAHRAARSRRFMTRIFDSYTIVNALGERRPLASLYAPAAPPGGAGDCAAPKLLGLAYARGLRPLALAELWWGPPADGREPGRFYPACRAKCGPLLPFMMRGLPVDDPPVFGAAAPPELPILHEDAHLVVVDKPAGLLSVPGRHALLRDSVATRLGATVVHRLDLETSGLLLAARDADTLRALQRQFARREVDKRYVAILAGVVADDRGTIDLPLRLDVDDRPRQLVDHAHGKPAVTDFAVLSRAGGLTRVAFHPHTGRTHQLRVHAAVGLRAPILGDRLYGPAAPRMMLHADSLSLTHPTTGARLTFESPAPF